MAGLLVVGLSGSALFQDSGRHHVDSGVPVSGAFDRDAHAAATALVGGTIEQASLEVVGMIEVVPDRPMTCAVTGRATVTVDGRPTASWTALDVPGGARVEVHAEGRAYLSVARGFQPTPVLGSRSSCLLGPIGPAPVGIGDLLPLAETCTSGTAGDFVRAPERGSGVRVVPGPHLRVGTCEVRVLESSRIGVRLTAGRLEGAATRSDPTCPRSGSCPGPCRSCPLATGCCSGRTPARWGATRSQASSPRPISAPGPMCCVGEVVHLEVIDAADAPDPAAPAVVRVQGLGG